MLAQNQDDSLGLTDMPCFLLLSYNISLLHAVFLTIDKSFPVVLRVMRLLLGLSPQAGRCKKFPWKISNLKQVLE
jgi:hypothetical protein